MNRLEDLKRRYGAVEGQSGDKTVTISTRPNRGAAMLAEGKPKNAMETISRLWHYLAHERVLLMVAIISAIVFTSTSLIASYLLRPIMNHYLVFESDALDIARRMKGLMMAMSILGINYLLVVVSQYLQARLMLQVSQKTLQRMRDDLYRKIQRLPIRYYDTHPHGDIMSRFTNDIDTIGEMLNTTLMQIISGLIMLAGTIVLMLYTNVILGMITIVCTPLLTLISRSIVKRGRSAFKRQQNTLGMLNGYIEETISGQKVVKVFDHESICQEEFTALNDELCDIQIHAQFVSGIMGPITHQLCNLIYAIEAVTGALLVISRGFDIGGLTVSLNYTRSFNRPINDISLQMNTIFAALAGAERIFDVMDEEEETEGDCYEMDKIMGHVILDHVYFGYTDQVTVLHDLELDVIPGAKVAFVGSTGAGKTTITNLLSRFYDLHQGQIYIDGVPINSIKRSFLRQNIAMVLQDTHLFTGTVMENIRYGRLDASDEEVIEAAKTASADSFIRHLEHGYDTVLENDGANLSQGQRQLLNIARCALSHAPILILDEATSSVDTRTEQQIDQGMDALMSHRTTFVIAHRLSTVRSADLICVLEHGRIIERGTHKELLALNGRYAALYHEMAELE